MVALLDVERYENAGDNDDIEKQPTTVTAWSGSRSLVAASFA
jgi:hypothetical protein